MRAAMRPKVSLAHLMVLCVLAAASGCGGGSNDQGELTVRIDAVAPACGSSADSNPLKVTGNMPEKPLVAVVDPSGNPVAVPYRAWMGNSELSDVTWIDRHTVTGVVPPMTSGTYALTLQGPLGGPVVKENAFRVSDSPCPSQSADLIVASAVAAPATLVIGEVVTVTASVENHGLATAKHVNGSVTSAPAGFSATGDAPGAQDIPSGEARAFTWTYQAASVDGGKFTIEAAGTAADTNQSVKAAPVNTNDVLVNPRSFLSCTSSATPAAASVGQVITVTLVATSHAAETIQVTPAVEATGPVQVATQPSAATVAVGSSSNFVWTYRTTGAGTAAFTASAHGNDAVTGEQVTVATAQTTVSVQSPAALATAVSVSPATVAGGQGRTVTVSAVVRNNGGATATNVIPSIASAPGGTTLSGTAPPSQDVPGGESRTFSWIYGIGASAGGTFSVNASGTDANTQQAVSAPAATSNALVVTYAVGASLSGLTGTGLVLRNGSDSLTVSPNTASVTFPTPVAYGASYEVSVATQPSGQTCTVTGGSGTMGTADVTASVSCSTNSYTLSTSVSPGGAGSVACNGAACQSTYAYNTSVTLTATAASGYSFSSWSGDCSGTGTCTVTMTADRSVTANFTAITYTLSTSVSPSGGGTVTCDGGACQSSYAYNTTVNLTATAASGYSFSSWSGDCSGTGTCTVTMNANRSVTANFTANPTSYTLSTSVDPSGSGTVSCDGGTCQSTYAAGTKVSLTQTAASGYTFSSWSGCDTVDSSGACSVTMNGNRSVTANFTANPTSYTLSTSVDPSGSGTVSCDGGTCQSSYTSGATVNLTATAASGYTFSGWSGDCSGTENTCTLTMSANRSVTANFTANPTSYTLSTSVAPTDSGTVSCDGGTCQSSYAAGTTVNLTATPASGYSFGNWSGDCTGTTCTLTMNANHSVTANFTSP